MSNAVQSYLHFSTKSHSQPQSMNDLTRKGFGCLKEFNRGTLRKNLLIFRAFAHNVDVSKMTDKRAVTFGIDN